MPTNDERRKVARRLREIDFEGAFDLHEKIEMVGDVISDPFSDMLVNDFTNRLADLIEPGSELTNECDRDALLNLADDLEEEWHLFDDARSLSVCERIRKACGIVDTVE